MDYGVQCIGSGNSPGLPPHPGTQSPPKRFLYSISLWLGPGLPPGGWQSRCVSSGAGGPSREGGGSRGGPSREGGGSRGPYRGARVYLPLRSKLQPERTANHRKELRSKADTWEGDTRGCPAAPEWGRPSPESLRTLQWEGAAQLQEANTVTADQLPKVGSQ